MTSTGQHIISLKRVGDGYRWLRSDGEWVSPTFTSPEAAHYMPLKKMPFLTDEQWQQYNPLPPNASVLTAFVPNGEEQPLTAREIRRIIYDLAELVEGPEHGVITNSELYEKAVKLREFLATKGYEISTMVEQRYKYLASRP